MRIIILLITTLSFSSCDNDERTTVEYPAVGFYGENILFKEKTDYTRPENSLKCRIPERQKVKIIISGLNTTSVSGPFIPAGAWIFDGGTINNWYIQDFNFTNNTQTFLSIDGGLSSDVKMMFDTGRFQIDYYENGSSIPTSTKTMRVDY